MRERKVTDRFLLYVETKAGGKLRSKGNEISELSKETNQRLLAALIRLREANGEGSVDYSRIRESIKEATGKDITENNFNVNLATLKKCLSCTEGSNNDWVGVYRLGNNYEVFKITRTGTTLHLEMPDKGSGLIWIDLWGTPQSEFITAYRTLKEAKWSEFPVGTFVDNLKIDAAADSQVISVAALEEQRKKQERQESNGTALAAEMSLDAVRGTATVEPVEVATALQSAPLPRLFLLGDAGDGKSTLLQKTALYYLKTQPECLPVLISARRFEDTEQELWDYLETEYLKGTGQWSKSGPELLAQFTAGNGVLLIDGLDECRDPAGMGNKVRHFLSALNANNLKPPKSVPILITCRKHFDTNLLPDFAKYVLKPLTLEQIAGYAEQRLDAVAALAGNGLMLAMMTDRAAKQPADRPLSLPVARDTLYDWAVERLLAEPKTVGRTLHTDKFYSYPDFKRAILEEIAFRAQFLLKRNLDIPKATVDECLKDLTSGGRNWYRYEHERHLIMEDIVSNSELLQKTNGDNYRFPHPTFQEYWAARFLLHRYEEAEDDMKSGWADWLPIKQGWLNRMEQLHYLPKTGGAEHGFHATTENVLPSFGSYIWRPSYRETLLLFAGMLAKEQREIRLIDGFCFDELTVNGYQHDWKVSWNETEDGGKFAYVSISEEAVWDDLENTLVVRRLTRFLQFGFAVAARLHTLQSVPIERLSKRGGALLGKSSILSLAEPLYSARKSQNACQTLESVAKDTTVDAWTRQKAVEKLAELGNVLGLESVAKDTTVGAWIRRSAAEKLAELGTSEQRNTACQTLESVAKDTTVDAWIRQSAAEKLAELGTSEQRNTACQTLESVAKDTTVDARIRQKAINKLADIIEAQEETDDSKSSSARSMVK
jgi:uncharacterized protein (UPF0147 family)